MKLLLSFSLLCIPFLGDAQARAPQKVLRTNTECLVEDARSLSLADARYEVNTRQMANKSWSYDLLANGRLYFHQETRPGQIAGTGFNSQEEAEQVAKLVIQRLKTGNQPPTVTEQELSELHLR